MITNFHIHTEYSMLESAVRIKDLVELAVQYRYPALAITDINGIYGVIRFFQLARAHNIKPVIGSLIKKGDEYIILLARNNTGYYEINTLISSRNLSEGSGEKFDLLSFINRQVKNCFILSPYASLLGRIRKELLPFVFFEVPLTWPEQEKEKIIKYSAEMKIEFIPALPVHFLRPEDYDVFKLLVSIKKNIDIFQSAEECADKKNNYFPSLDEFGRMLRAYPCSAERIDRIIRECRVEFEFNRTELPQIKFSRRRPPFKKLAHLCMRSLNRRFPLEKESRPYVERLQKEISVIRQLSLESYFLIVYRVVRYAREQKISYTGRGSAANSLVCFLLDFTFVDPLEYDLYFERFLHVKRRGLPDIDLDFPWNKRDKIIRFIYDTFKPEHTALISTHITFNVRSAVRETAKAFGLDERQISLMTKKIPFFFMAEGLTKITKELPEFGTLDLKESLWEKILYYAEKIIHIPRYISIHPGGMVISRWPLACFTAIEKAPKGFYVTQLDMYDIEKLGLLKIDILGQRSLAVIDRVLESIKPRQMPDIRDICRDENTVRLIKEGLTIGCFYIESPAMRQLLKKLQVTTFRELTAASSVIRPGVAESGMMQKYIQFHRNPGTVTYIHEDLKELLKETYGIMIYQEDVIKVFSKIAGLEPEQGDIMRKAMSGKSRSRDAVKDLQEKFISGCMSGGYSFSAASLLWAQIESFAGYAFCKAHSASFARISFLTAYLKYYFPAQFIAAVLSNRGGFYAPFVYIEEARRLGLKILPPDVNCAGYNFLSCGNGIITGLSFIKNLSAGTVKKILEQRKKKKFHNLFDFIHRCGITDTEFLLLAKCGALDQERYNRKQLLFMAGHINRIRKNLNTSLFFDTGPVMDVPLLSELSLSRKILFEIEMLGFSCTANPLVLAPARVKIVYSHEMKHYAGRTVNMMGVRIFSRRIPSRKKAGFMKFISFIDRYGTFETFLSLKNYDRLVHLSIASSILLVSGRVSEEFGACTLQIEDIIPISLESACMDKEQNLLAF